MKGKIEIDKERCKGCGLCITVCPKGQIEISDELNKKGYYPASFKEAHLIEADESECTGCALCGLVCPDVAIDVYKKKKDKSGSEKEAESDVR